MWNKDFKPGQTPTTEEERIKAAKKYGMHPDDYKVFPDDGINNAGDYPNIDQVSAEARDPHEDYDFPEHRRYWGEPVSKY